MFDRWHKVPDDVSRNEAVVFDDIQMIQTLIERLKYFETDRHDEQVESVRLVRRGYYKT